MVDIELRVLSDRREGLLLALGPAVIAGGYSLLRQRMLSTAEGIVLTMVVRGPREGLPMLEERLAAHPLVCSFETMSPDAPQKARSQPRQASNMPAPAPADEAPVDAGRAEMLLPQLARAYPNIFVQLLTLERELPPAQRESTLCHIGQRVGSWVYRRDYFLGGRLALDEAARRIALPAIRQIVQAELQDNTLRIRNSPFVHRGEDGACCHFLRGMIGGLLAGSDGSDNVQVAERQCRNAGADICCFEFA